MTQMFILIRQAGVDGKHQWTILISPIVDLKPTDSLIQVKATQVTEDACEILTRLQNEDLSAAITVVVDIVNGTDSYLACDQIYRKIQNLNTNNSRRILHFFEAFCPQLSVLLEAIQQIIVSLLNHKSGYSAT
jgi:hypothetical protein